MGSIQKLDLFTANRIAAGEVVERPASAVKELLENAIDAGASAISVAIEGGGIRRIRVTDNGCGIPEAELELAFERHATSKIHRADDLDRIATLGFRGEALNSIAAVAQVQMQTRTPGSEFGAQIDIAGGELRGVRALGCPDGTSICVENLFFNTPARLEFLRKPALEAGAVGDIVARYLLAKPGISFKYSNGGKLIYHSPGDGDLRSGLYCIYGKEVLEALKALDYEDKQLALRIHGYVTRSEAARPNRKAQSFFVNGRYVHAPLLSRAVQEAFGSRLMGGRFPLCTVCLTLPYEAVDANIHPHKMELRFKQETAIARAMMDAVQQSLAERHAVTWHAPVEEAQPTARRSTAGSAIHQPDMGAVTTPTSPSPENSAPTPPLPAQQPLAPQPIPTAPKMDDAPLREVRIDESLPWQKAALKVRENSQQMDFWKEGVEGAPPLRILGQVFATYIVVEQGDQLFWVDQHAAHERMIYDELVASTQYQSAQTLLVPYELLLDSEQYAILQSEREALTSMGFAFDDEDGQLVRVHSVPQLFAEAETGAFLLEVIAAIQQAQGSAAARLKRHDLATYACKHAIRAHDILTQEQMAAILRRFEELGEWNCPHGRPIVIRMTRRELEKLFKRIV